MKDNRIVRTRYAPSPTGRLHIGGARTALFNYLFAKRNNGNFILRIEDTDTARNIKDGHLQIEKDLKFLNIFPDESFSIPGANGPYLQSQKGDRYLELCQRLLREGKAYRCFCSEEELEIAREKALRNNTTPTYSRKCRDLGEEVIGRKLSEGKPFAVRLKMDILQDYIWDDLLRGDIRIPSNSLGDYIIMRSNGTPTYNFAVVVDDYDMCINYVLRGEEHISNTPYQIATYHALGWGENIPKFGHLSIIVDRNKKKLSKRSADENHFISGLVNKGYSPGAIINFLVLMGWSCGEEEIFSPDELKKRFSLDGLSRAPALYDLDKLNWISKKYFQDMTETFYLNFVGSFFTEDLGVFNCQKNIFALSHKDSISHATQLNKLARDFYSERSLIPSQVEFLRGYRDLLRTALSHFPPANDGWEVYLIKNYLKQLEEITGKGGSGLYKPLRVATLFLERGFDLVRSMASMGRDRVLENLKTSVKCIG